jgi:hypothetical protein
MRYTQELICKIHSFIACSCVGMILRGSEVSILLLIPIGQTHTKNKILKIIHASKKFIKIPAKTIIAC